MFFTNRNRSASGGPIDPPPADGKRRKWVTLAWVALFSLSLAGFQMRLALSGTLSAEVGGGGDAPLTCPPACGIAFTVDSTGDGHNVGPVTQCNDGTNHCTLRAAIEAANSHAGDDGISFNIPTAGNNCDASGNCTINLTAALPQLTTNISITGPGPNALTVRPGTAGQYRVFIVTGTSTVVTITGLTISNGGAHDTNGGGGLQNGTATVNVTNCLLTGNRSFLSMSNGIGGAICNGTGTMNISDSVITGNKAEGGGGGIFNRQGTVNLVRSTVSDNQADGAGGGINNPFDFNQTPTLNVTNSTISDNTSGMGGGGIFGGGTTSITNSTITGNVASTNTGGGITSPPNTTNVKSTIVALNTAPSAPDVSGNCFSAGFNLIGKIDGSTGFTVATDQTGTIASPLDPKLDPNGLQNNGGPTKTIVLLAGSPAIDKGTSNGLTGQLTFDQRGAGFARTFDDPATPNATGGDGTDIGSFELQMVLPTIFANISTRLLVETGDNVLIGGFIITGTQPKKVIVRAIGPSLPLGGVLADPVLELHGPGAFVTITNDNWRSNQEAEIIATGIPPTNDLESAIVATLPANNSAYTAIVRGVNDGTGIGLVEAYDLDRTVDSKLANISTRGLVQTGDNVLIAGTIVFGQASQNVIVRAIGPSLNLPGRLADPTLELRDGNGGLVRSNDNWRSDQEAEIIATGIPPTNDLESAIVATLPANGASYTAIVRGVNNTTGIAVVEVYALN
jgi:CSLREA domain-containing protein